MERLAPRDVRRRRGDAGILDRLAAELERTIDPHARFVPRAEDHGEIGAAAAAHGVAEPGEHVDDPPEARAPARRPPEPQRRARERVAGYEDEHDRPEPRGAEEVAVARERAGDGREERGEVEEGDRVEHLRHEAPARRAARIVAVGEPVEAPVEVAGRLARLDQRDVLTGHVVGEEGERLRERPAAPDFRDEPRPERAPERAVVPEMRDRLAHDKARPEQRGEAAVGVDEAGPRYFPFPPGAGSSSSSPLFAVLGSKAPGIWSRSLSGVDFFIPSVQRR